MAILKCVVGGEVVENPGSEKRALSKDSPVDSVHTAVGLVCKGCLKRVKNAVTIASVVVFSSGFKPHAAGEITKLAKKELKLRSFGPRA